MNILLLILIVILGISAVHFLRKSKAGTAWAKPAAAACSIAVIALATVSMLAPGNSKQIEQIMAQQEKYQTICGEVVGRALAQRHPEARVVILALPVLDEGPTGMMVKSMKQALTEGGASVVIESPELPEQNLAQMKKGTAEADEEYLRMMMDTMIWFSGEQLKETLEKHKESADLVVCTLALAEPVSTVDLPAKGAGPALVMLFGETLNTESLLENTLLDAIVRYRNNPDAWKPDAQMPEEMQAAFDSRYELVTAKKI